ncbi:MAG: DUF1573 domain-containing protein [Sedimentisphaerales bacterium]
MNNRFYGLLIFVMVSLVLVFSYQSQARPPKAFDQPAASRSSAPSEKAAAKEPNATGTAPHLQFDNTVHDFCEISPDSINDYTFTFKNTGLGTLNISQTRGSCKCTVPELSKKEYAPGESGQISVQYHAPTYPGPTAQTVHVTSNDPQNPVIQLTLKAVIVSKVRVTPDTMTLSIVDTNNAGAVPVTIKSLDGERFAVTGVDSEGGVFTVAFDHNNISDTHTLYPKVNIEKLRTYLGGYLVFSVNHPSCRSVRMQYNCLKEFEASPAVIIIRDANVGQPQSRTVYLTSNYNEPIEIEPVTSEKGFVKAVSQEKTENRFKIDVQIIPPPRQGDSRVFSDILHIKIKNKEDIPIQCRGFYKAGV